MKNLLLSFVVILLSIISLSAQYGEISGRVTDTSGVGIQYASVYFNKKECLLGLLTDSSGYYTIKGILPGSYTVRSEYIGKKSYEEKRVVVVENNITRVDMLLEESDNLDLFEIIECPIFINHLDIVTSTGRIEYLSRRKKSSPIASNISYTPLP